MSAGNLSYVILLLAATFFLAAFFDPKMAFVGTGIDLAWLLALAADYIITPPAKLVSAWRSVYPARFCELKFSHRQPEP